MSLRDSIVRVRQAMPGGQYVNEAAVSTGVVLPFLQDLGWPVFDPTIVAPEYTVEGRRVDFALCHPRSKPAVFIEVKQPGKSEGGDRQLFEYSFHLGIPLAVLTDGREWHFYLPAGQGAYQERRVYKLDLIDRDISESEARLARYLSYKAVQSGAAHKAAQDDYASLRKDREIASTVPLAWRKLLEEKDELLVDLLSDQVESLCGYKPDPDLVTRFLAQEVGRQSPAAPAGNAAASKSQPSRDRSPRVQAITDSVSLPVSVPTTTGHTLGFSIQGKDTSTRSARETLIRFFEAMAHQDPTFLTRFAALPRHGRSRRFLAANKRDLYPGREDLAAEFSHEIAPGWWLGTNYGAVQIQKIIAMACEVAGLQLDRDVQVHV